MVAVSPFVSYTAVGCRPASLSVCSSHDKAFFYLPVDIQHISVSVTTFHPQEIDPLCGNQTGWIGFFYVYFTSNRHFYNIWIYWFTMAWHCIAYLLHCIAVSYPQVVLTVLWPRSVIPKSYWRFYGHGACISLDLSRKKNPHEQGGAGCRPIKEITRTPVDTQHTTLSVRCDSSSEGYVSCVVIKLLVPQTLVMM